MIGLLTIQDDHFVLGDWASDLGLKLSHDAIHRCQIHGLEHARKCRLTRGRVPTLAIGPDAQSPPLCLG